MRSASRVSRSDARMPSRLVDFVRALCHGAVPARRHAFALADREHDGFEHGKTRKQRRDLERPRQAALDPLVLRQARDPLLREEDLARGRRIDAGQQIDERGLAGAIGSDQRVARAGRQREADLARRLEAAPVLRQPRRTQRGIHGAAPAEDPAKTGSPAEDAVAREQHDDHEQQSDPELPVHRIDARQDVLRDHVDRRADERAVEPSGAAQHQHDHDLRGTRKAE